MLAEEWRHDRVFSDFERALQLAKCETWPLVSKDSEPVHPDDVAEVVYWAASYGRVMYRPEFGPPEPSDELDLVVVARMWDGRHLALVVRTGPEGWSGECTSEATVTAHLSDAIVAGLDERAQESLGFAGWHR